MDGTVSALKEVPALSFDAELRIGRKTTQVTFDVYGQWLRGFPGSRETPAEPKSFDPRLVLMNDEDVTAWMSSDWFSELIFDEIYRRD